jgi:WD40 repeat protein
LAAPVTNRFTTGTASGRAVALRFDEQPVNTIVGAIMPASVVVSAVDVSGSPASGFTGVINLAIGTNPGSGLLAGTTARVARPRAAFTDLRVNGAGEGYTLVATSDGLSSATSSPFDIIEMGPARNVIAFSSYGQGIVAASAINGVTIGVLVPHPGDGADVGEPVWAPDGTRLAFTRWTEGFGRNGQLFLVNADGSSVTELHQEGHSPAWSPDGNRIAFTGERDGNSEVYVMRTDGSEALRLTNDPGEDSDPAWSPDGARLVYVHDSRLRVMNADGSGKTSLGPVGVAPAWSPDGTRIAFWRYHDSVIDIYLVDADGSGLTNLTGNQFAAYSYAPAWSPDGSRIVYSHTPDADIYPSSIHIIGADGSGARRFSPPIDATTLRASLDPAWSRQ